MVSRDSRPFRTEVDQRTASTRFTYISSEGRWNNELIQNSTAKSCVIRTRTTESDEEENHVDKKSGYILVDLKGDKVVHTDQDYLVGCEVQSYKTYFLKFVLLQT